MDRERRLLIAEANMQEFVDTLPEPLNRLAKDIFDYNRHIWFQEDKNGTLGQEAIIHTGFTKNQNEYLVRLKHKLQESESLCNKEDKDEIKQGDAVMIVELKNGEFKKVNSIDEIKDQSQILETYVGATHTSAILNGKAKKKTKTEAN